MDTVSIRIPYRKVKQEVELVDVDKEQLRRLQIRVRGGRDVSAALSTSSSLTATPVSNGGIHHEQLSSQRHNSLLTLILSCTIAAAVQFFWALQLSLPTPYIQVVD